MRAVSRNAVSTVGRLKIFMVRISVTEIVVGFRNWVIKFFIINFR